MNQPDAPFARTTQKLGLYPVVDSVLWIERLLKLGVRTIQLRIKDRTDAQVDEQIRTAITLGKHYQVRIFINDYWQLAVKHGAYGVHLGQEDLGRADLQAIQHAGLRLGISTHDESELQRAKALHPSYIALGHIFPTQTKEMPSSPQGLDNLARQVAATPEIPTVAIGGISCEIAPKVLATGVSGIAVVSAITKAADWQAATRQLLRLTGEYTEIPEVSHAQ